MNIIQKQEIMHSCKMLAVCGAAIYLAIGVTKLGNERISGVIANDEMYSEWTRLSSVEELSVTPEEPQTEVVEEAKEEQTPVDVSTDLYTEDNYLLAKIAMAEAEGEDIKGKALVIRVVLNRVESNDFPDDIEEVILQNDGNCYQFSPVRPEGRWWTTEPNEDCWEAVRMVQEEQWDESYGAMYFESKGDSEWHRNNLEYLFQHGGHHFYR